MGLQLDEVPPREEREKDLMKALIIKRRGEIGGQTSRRSKKHYGKVCGEKFGNKETFEKYWNDRLIGRLMRKLGFPRKQISFPWWKEPADGTIIEY